MWQPRNPTHLLGEFEMGTPSRIDIPLGEGQEALDLKT
jgi:hypothetical protein